MSQQQGIVKGDTLQKLASLGFIIGGLLLIIFYSMLPRVDLKDFMMAWGSSAGLVNLAEFFIALGLWGIMIGAAGVYRSIAARGAAWARLGFYGIIVGTVIGTIGSGTMNAMVSAFSSWLGQPDASKDMWLTISIAVVTVCGSVNTMFNLAEWLALVFLGIGMARSQVYPKWMGWAALILGAVTVGVGIPRFFTGLTNTIQLAFGVMVILTGIWALVVGIWVARKAW